MSDEAIMTLSSRTETDVVWEEHEVFSLVIACKNWKLISIGEGEVSKGG